MSYEYLKNGSTYGALPPTVQLARGGEIRYLNTAVLDLSNRRNSIIRKGPVTGPPLDTSLSISGGTAKEEVMPAEAPLDYYLPPEEPTFYENYKSPILIAGGLVGAFALYKMVKK